MDKLVSKENLKKIVDLIVEHFSNEIANKDISLPYKEQLNKANIIQTDGDGNAFLNINGEYFPIDIDKVNETKEKIQNIKDIFNIKKEDGEISYDLDLSSNPTLSKADILSNSGDGNKYLSNNGEYIGIEPTINPIPESDIQSIIDSL